MSTETNGAAKMPGHIEFGWGAAPFGLQLPTLSTLDAAHFDKDNEAIVRLSLRGFLTEAERDRAIKRVTREVRAALTKAVQS
jgi:hypothetical protein